MEAALSGEAQLGLFLLRGVGSRWVDWGWLSLGACAPQVPLPLIGRLIKAHVSHDSDKGTHNRHSVIFASFFWSASYSAMPEV